jgi:hypothetical protein
MPRIEKQFFETEVEEASEFTHLFGLPPATVLQQGREPSTPLNSGGTPSEVEFNPA